MSLESRQALDLDRPVGEAVGEVLVVLLGEQRGRHQYRDLATALNGDEGGAHGDLGLAEAHVAAHQTIHRSRRYQVFDHGVDRSLLIGRFFELESRRELLILVAGGEEGVSLARFAACIDVEQFGRDVAHALRSLALDALPLVTAQSVQRCVIDRCAGITANQMQGRHRHVKLVALGVLEVQKLLLQSRDVEGAQAEITSHTMIFVHHRFADVQFGQVANRLIDVEVAAFAPALLLDALAEQQ